MGRGKLQLGLINISLADYKLLKMRFTRYGLCDVLCVLLDGQLLTIDIPASGELLDRTSRASIPKPSQPQLARPQTIHGHEREFQLSGRYN
jgi:hypothetical protein